ncbi:hypothetical protein KKH13_05125 [Patescibacteria group bacterium]|nr:hypothetical protein [Patescibacteria group bacterium]
MAEQILNSAQLMYIMMLNTLGLTVVEQALVEARNFVHGSHKKSDKQSYLFVKGTGLEVVIEQYQLGYDGTRLKESFFWNIRTGRI